MKMRTITAHSQDSFLYNPRRGRSILSSTRDSFSIQRISDTWIPERQYEELSNKKKEYEKQIEAQQAVDEVALFEKKIYGVYHQPPNLTKTPLNPQEARILAQNSQPEESQFYDLPNLQHQSKLREFQDYHFRPSGWHLVDEPLILSRPTKTSLSNRMNPKPFKVTTNHGYTTGIPLLKKELLSNHKTKLGRYNASVLLAQTCDNQVKEEKFRVKYDESKEFSQKIAQEQVEKCAKLGQKWALKKLEGPKPQAVVVPPPDEVDLEAIQQVSRKEEEKRRESFE